MIKSHRSSCGGNLKDYPNWAQLLRSVMFPAFKRKVTVKVTTWVHEDANATHYYVSFTVEDNPLLIQCDDGYIEKTLWDHPKEHKGYRLNWDDAISYDEIAETSDYEALKLSFTDPNFTLEFAQRIAREKFPEDTYEIIWEIEALGL